MSGDLIADHSFPSGVSASVRVGSKQGDEFPVIRSAYSSRGARRRWFLLLTDEGREWWYRDDELALDSARARPSVSPAAQEDA